MAYLELAKQDDVPDLLKFVPFFDWDRGKAARRELVDAFLAAPAWHPRDLALTACRANCEGYFGLSNDLTSIWGEPSRPAAQSPNAARN